MSKADVIKHINEAIDYAEELLEGNESDEEVDKINFLLEDLENAKSDVKEIKE